MEGGSKARRYLGSPLSVAGVGRREHETASLNFELDPAVKIKVPVKAVVVVADSSPERDDQAALAPCLFGLGEKVSVLPQYPEVFLMQTNRLRDITRFSIAVGQYRIKIVNLT